MKAFSPAQSMTGTMGTVSNISGKISNTKELDGNISIPEAVDVPEYKGDYVVIPKAYTEQVLETQGRKMNNNVTVKEVPYYETSNVDGGETVYIAGEVTYG